MTNRVHSSSGLVLRGLEFQKVCAPTTVGSSGSAILSHSTGQTRWRTAKSPPPPSPLVTKGLKPLLPVLYLTL